MDKNKMASKSMIMRKIMGLEPFGKVNPGFIKEFEAVREFNYSEKCKPHIQELRSFYFWSPNDTPIIGNFCEPILPGTPHFSFLRAGRIYRLLAAGMEYREAMTFIRLFEKSDNIFEKAFQEWKEKTGGGGDS